MTVHLDLPADVVNRLNEEARQRGLSLDAYLLQTILQWMGLNGASADEAEKRRKRADAGARILEIQKRVKPDPEGWTSRDYINRGRH
jgi:CubicO group peptidase (beta-lactamase class C family)